jgi:hypothetical protein
MLKTTEERFRRKLREDINRLCELDENLFLDENKFDSIFGLYNRYRDVIHDCMKKDNKNVKMDRHKIAAAFFCAILKAKPIGKKPDAAKFLERTVNEQLALIFSLLYVIDTFNISDKHKTKMDREIYELYIKLPECLHSEVKDYMTNFIMLIDETQRQFLDIDSENFQSSSLFIVSHIFFLIDVFSYEKNRNLIIENGFAP